MTLNIMMGRSRGVRRWMLSAMMALWVVLVAVGAARAELSDREQFVNLIYEGRLQEACDFLSNRPAEVVGEDVKGLEPLLERYAELEATRRERKGASYGEAVEEARKELAAGEVEKALSGVRKAKFYAEDEQQFGQQEWVKQVVAEALLKAEQYLADHEWLKAGNIYGELSTIYEDEKQYEDKTKECATRARIESLYESGEDWQEQVKGIKMDVLAEISYHVENYYVDDPDLRKLTLGGLESLALFTQIEKLKENFPVLADSEKVGAYNERVAGLIEQVKAEKQESFSETDLMRAFVKFMMINQETLELPENLVTREFVDGAMFKLDQFSGVIWPYEMDDFQKHTLGKFSGVGIQITMDKNKLKVITPIFGTPAYKAGIEPGAFITSIDGESTDGITIDQAVRKITGPKGTIVRLGILHSWADDPVDIPIMRDTIIIHTVKGAKLETDDAWDYLIDPEDKIAYLRITSFTESTVEDLHEAIRQIESSGARGLIVDLRFNPGGTLRAAVDTADIFLEDGVIVSTKGRAVDSYEGKAETDGPQFDLPLVVLINNISASGSEIVCGALRDHGRAMVIGERSYGKGSVQNVIRLANGASRLKLTTAYYYLPSGICLHRRDDAKEWGVDPNIEVALSPEELRDVMELQRDAEVIQNHKEANGASAADEEQGATDADEAEGEGSVTTTTSTAPAEASTQPAKKEYPRVDPQLETALLVMKTRLATELPWKPVLQEEKLQGIARSPVSAIGPKSTAPVVTEE
ncbi:MAG: S41 family peptidase [Phycisphaerae bacterium]|nr:S41 family peptidase [Phycisphaerae bacterium]